MTGTRERLRLRLDGFRAARELRRRARGLTDISRATELAFAFDHRGFKIDPWQQRSEIEALLERLRREPPRTVLEIGSARGGTLFLFTRVAADDALLISVDLPGGSFGGDGDPATARAAAPLLRSFARGRQRIELVRGDSTSAETVQRVNRLLGGRQLDFLLVDGDHSYEGVKADFELYAPLVRPGGLVACHDIVHGLPEYVGGVPDFWAEVKRDRVVEEYVEDWEQGGWGIGVIVQGNPSG